MELRIEPYKLPESPVFNFDELKTALQEKMALYEAAIYTDDQIKQAKMDKAALNKLRKALNDERIKREREYMQPFNAFKAQVNEIIGIIDRPVQAIDRQIKEVEERRRNEREKEIWEYWVVVDAPEWMRYMEMKWLNASVSMAAIRKEIDAAVEQMSKDIAVVRNLPDYAFEAAEVYKHTHSLNDALSEAHRLSEMARARAAYDAEMARRKAEQAEARKAPGQPAKAEVFPGERQWLGFKALLTVDDAKALREFFDARGIEFRAL